MDSSKITNPASLKQHQLDCPGYTFISQAGKGVYGTVFKARSNITGQKVAIKFITFQNSGITHMRSVARELKVNLFLSGLQQNLFTPLLIDIVFPGDFNKNDPSSLRGIYLVQEYFDFTLEDVLGNVGVTLSQSQAKVLAYNLLCAIKFLHSCNIMHRDLKPENILITDEVEIKICDFGLSRSIKVEQPNKMQRKRSFACFTRPYRPPEVIMCQSDYDERSDLWSIGCILSEVFRKTVSP